MHVTSTHAPIPVRSVQLLHSHSGLYARAAARARGHLQIPKGCPFSVSAPSQSSTPLSKRHSPPSRYPLGAPPSRNAPALSEQHTLSERHSNRENFLILTHEHVGWSLSVEGVLLDGWAGNAPSQDVISAAVPVVPPRFTPRFIGWPGKHC